MSTKYKHFLFNFSTAFSGGGLKRLYEYSRWFNDAGGSNFIIRKEKEELVKLFPNNNYFIVSIGVLDKIFDTQNYIKTAIKKIGKIEVFYSYGVPFNEKYGKVNCLHICNVLPLVDFTKHSSIMGYPRLFTLKRRIKSTLKYTDLLTAESTYSLTLIKDRKNLKKEISFNGSDDEIKLFSKKAVKGKKEKDAVCVGTYKYKKLEDVVKVYNELNKKEPELKLNIIGNKKNLPAFIFERENINTIGFISRSEVTNWLSHSKYYISTTAIENSYNASSEGIFLATESYISNIEPHRELLDLCSKEYDTVIIGNRTYFHVSRSNLESNNLSTWNQVINKLMSDINNL